MSSSPSHHNHSHSRTSSTSSTPSPSPNPKLPTTRPMTEIRSSPAIISNYQSLLSLPPRSPLIPLKIAEFPRPLLKKPPTRPLPPILQFFIPRRRPLLPHQRCNLCPLHSPLLESPLVHLSTLLSYEMYIHLQSLRALHPALRSEVTNTMLEKLHPWCDEKRIFLPGSTVQGCLACALGLLYNDTGAMNALAVLGKSWFRRGVGYGRLVEEGWLGWWAEETKGVREVRADRKKARRETGVSNAEWVDRGEGVEFRDVVWGQKPSRQQQKRGSAITMGRQQGEKREEVRLMGPPARPERVKGQTLWTREESKMERISATRFPDLQGPKSAVAEEEKEEEEEKRWSGTTLGSTRYSTKPPTPEKSKPRGQYQHVDRSPVSPLSPRSRPGFPEAGNRPTSFHNQQAPTMRRTKTDATQHSRARKEVSIPPPLNPHRPTLAHNRARYPYESQRPHSSTTSHPLAPQNPFTDSPPISSSPSTTSSSWTSSISDTESIVGPSILDGDYSDSDSEYEDDNAYGERDRDTRQRYLDEHDELMKLVGAPGWSRGKPRTRDYLNTLPLREETRERTTRTRGGEVSVA